MLTYISTMGGKGSLARSLKKGDVFFFFIFKERFLFSFIFVYIICTSAQRSEKCNPVRKLLPPMPDIADFNKKYLIQIKVCTDKYSFYKKLGLRLATIYS